MVNLIVRNEVRRLLLGKEFKDYSDSYELMTDSGFKILQDLRGRTYSSQMENEANLLYQMALLKCLSIRKLFDGLEYQNSIDGTIYKHTWDPFSVWPIVRSQFEALFTLNHIYLFPNDSDKTELLYNLWVLSGLNYRQRFKTSSSINIQKKANELITINNLKNHIQTSTLYNSLAPDNKNKIDKAIKNKEWQFYFNGNVFEFSSWQKIALNAGCNNNFIEDFYSYLCLNTHPSNVSVFQFRDLYLSNAHYESSAFALEVSRILLAFLIRDYCIYNPDALITFNALPPISQILVNATNESFRSTSYKLNDISNQF